MADYSPEVARELYPIALRQARGKFLLSAGVTAALAAATAVGELDSGRRTFGGIRLFFYAAVGLTTTVVTWRQWRRLKNSTAEEAGEAGLL